MAAKNAGPVFLIETASGNFQLPGVGFVQETAEEPAGPSSAWLAAEVRLGGLEARRAMAGALAAEIRLGGLEVRRLASGALSGEVRAGGMQARVLHRCALAAETRSGGLQTARLSLAALAGRIDFGAGLEARTVGGFCVLAGQVETVAEGSFGYDINVPRGPGALVGVAWRQSGAAVGASAGLAWSQANATARRDFAASWRAGQALSAAESTAWSAPPRRSGRWTAVWGEGHSKSAETRLAMIQPPARRASVLGVWGAGTPRGAAVIARFGVGQRLAARFDLAFGPGVPIGRGVAVAFGSGQCLARAWLLVWGEGHPLAPGRTTRPPPPEPPTPYQGQNNLRFAFELEPGNRLIFNRTRPLYIVIPRRRTYIVSNSFALYRLSDGLELPALSASASTDADSWCWSLSAALATEAAAGWVAPTGDGPVEVRLMINGTEWDGLVEDPELSESWSDSSSSIRGRSLTAYLDEPYTAASRWLNVADRTAAQLAGDALPVDVLLDFGLEDWLVEAGIWSFEGTPVRALARIAEAGGGVLASDKTGLGFAIAPRYPVLPWNWIDATPYAQIPRSYFASRGRRWLTKPAYNLAIVAGEVGGVLGRIKRFGTAGDWPAPHVVDRLATASAAVRQRGERILADTGRQALETIALPIGSELGLIPEGALLEFLDTVTWRGVVRSVSVSAKLVDEALDVEQVLEVERHYG
jgi:hypothetical protein